MRPSRFAIPLIGALFALAAAAQAWGEQLPAESPGVNSPLHRNKLGYHLREGIHSLAPYDWSQFLTFASRLWSTPSSPS